MPRKKNASGTAKTKKLPTRRSARRADSQYDAIPDVYHDMLAEAYDANPEDFQPDPRPRKRRKVNFESEETTAPAKPVKEPSPIPTRSPSPISGPPQVVFNDDFDESDSDAEFEDVEIDDEEENDSADRVEPKAVQIDLSRPLDTPRKAVQRRKPVTKAERDLRLDVHKWHLLCLLIHIASRNRWCDDEQVQKTLKPLISRKLISRLHREGTQVERKFAFEQAVEEILQTWKATWQVTSRSARRAYWREGLDLETEVDDAEDPVDLEDFREAAKECAGSRDLGAQLFCALMRSLAVETRLVCSLQVLPFSRAAKGETPQKPGPSYIQAVKQNFGSDRSSSKKQKKSVVDSPFPIWWVEVFNPAIDQWLPVDPLVRSTFNKPRTGFEPPASDNLNSMSYVIAFEEDGSAKDVTKRYTSAYNAKTRKTRVEVTKHGQVWYDNVIRFFDKHHHEHRDEIEAAALNRRVAQEGMPKNVQDFKDHPVYVLERHLRSNEVIEPRRECGKFTVGSRKNQRLEDVFRRHDVHACRSADGWYRKGKDVRSGEQPLKRVAKRRGGSIPPDDDEEDEGVALYAEYQTDVYVPPPVVGGRVPRNGYGNLDVYVPTMIPPGAVHIRHPLAAQAAKTLKIDAAEAVTGFKFKGRQGTAIIDGIVVDSQYTAAMIAATTAIEDELEERVNLQRAAILNDTWKKMHASLKVRQRLENEYGGQERDDNDDDDDPDYAEDAGGGFLAENVGEATAASRAEEAANLALLKDRQPVTLPPLVVRQQVIVVRSPHKVESAPQEAADDLFESGSEAGGFLPEPESAVEAAGDGRFLPETEDAARVETPAGFTQEVDEEAEESLPDMEFGLFDFEAFKAAGGDMTGFEDDGEAGGFVPEDVSQSALNITGRHFRPDLVADIAPRPAIARRSSASDSADKTSVAPLSGSQPSGQALLSTQNLSNGAKHKGKGKAEAAPEESDTEASILSQDPDEEDAEMQWVDDAFDE